MALAADLRSPCFRLGERRGLWRVIDNAFPVVLVGVAGYDAAGNPNEWTFRLELTGYPAAAPEARIWDIERNAVLAANLRPTGNRRLTEAFKHWGSDTVYRPWERSSGPHFMCGGSPQPASISNLYWGPSKDLAFILEDMHEVLNSDACARRAGKAA